MSRPAKPTAATLRDGPAIPAELVFLAMVAALTLMLALSGVPTESEATVTDGSPKLRQGWLAERQAESLAAAPSDTDR